MRFPQLPAMPASSIREWLDHELELRGIDAVIYTRYILSILQQDNFNLEPQERDLFPTCGKKKEYPPRKGKGKQKVNKMKFMDCEEMKKIAAVECLMSASEQKCGIEELVDELCSRLKNIQCEVECGTDAIFKPVSVQSALLPEADANHDSPEEQAEKYYAAFPALTINPEAVNIESVNSKYTSQCNSFWDGKKLLPFACKDQESDSSSENEEQLNCCQAASSEPEIACTTSAMVSSAQELEPTEFLLPEPKTVRHIAKSHAYQHHHHHHHHYHHHHHHLHGKSLKSGRECSGGKPSFIVPKCKYRILKQRVPFFKGRSPFRAPEFKLKHFTSTDVKCSLKTSCSHCFHVKKIEDIETAYDSSFEDGDLDETSLKRRPVKCMAEKCLLEDKGSDISVSFAEDSFSDVTAMQSPDGDLIDVLKDEKESANQDDQQTSSICTTDDNDILKKLEAKFNENLASIWCKHDITDSSFDRLSQMLETAFKTSLSVWFTNLRKFNAEDSFFSSIIVGTDEQTYWQTATKAVQSDPSAEAIKHSPGNLCDELLVGKAPYSKDNQVMVKNLGSLWCTQDDSYVNSFSSLKEFAQKTSDLSRIWQCESEKHNFIKGGVYGFENFKEYQNEESTLSSSSDLLEMDKVELHVETSSPALDADIDAFLLDHSNSTLESEAIGEEDMKLIWEVLGAIGRSTSSESGTRSPNILTATTFTNDSVDPGLDAEPISTTDEIQCNSAWEQLGQFDSWDMEKRPTSKPWGCSTFPLHAGARTSSPFKGLSALWSEADSDQPAEVGLAPSENDDNVSGIATAFRWGGAESYHQSLWDIWKDVTEDKNALDGDNVMNELSIFNNSNNDDHLSMTRSYDSYLNKEVVDVGAKLESLSRTQDHVHRSDPVLFGKQSILTYHKGESLFVEVKRQPNNDSLKNSTTKLFLSLNESCTSVRSNSSDNASVAISHLTAAFNNIMAGYSNNSESDKKETQECGDSILEEENLLTSPKTHFRPIRQLSCESDDTASSGEMVEPVNESERNLQEFADDNYAIVHVSECCHESLLQQSTSIFTQDDNGILRLSSESVDGEKKPHLYMLYKGQEVNKRQKHLMSAFIPKFKLRSDLEKFCQTEDLGTGPECNASETLLNEKCCDSICILESECSAGNTEVDKHCKINDGDFEDVPVITSETVLELCGTISSLKSITPRSEDNSDASGDDSIPAYSSADLSSGVATVAFGISKINARNFKEFDHASGSLWSAANEDDSSEGNDDDPWPPPHSDYTCINDIDERDFWAITKHQEKLEPNELKTLKEEIKKEEEQLFEDINQMRELDLHNEWDEDDEFVGMEMHNTLQSNKGKNFKWPVYQEAALDCQEDEDCPELEMINGGQCETISTWSQDADEYSEESLVHDETSTTCFDYNLFKRQDDTRASETSHCLPIIPTSKVIYSSDLEEEWMKQGRPFDIQVPKRSHVHKTKIKLYRRPCTFFMDGGCRRTDCKFSHDLASITCRFWEEGSCFKGITCPFLHGYPRKPSPLHKTNKPRDFRLESESDFPSLSKSADSTSSGSWMASNVSTKRKKKRNRPRHHSTSVAENDGEKCKSINLLDP